MEALKGDHKAVKVDPEALKGDEEALNGDGKPLVDEEEAPKYIHSHWRGVKRPRRCVKG